VRSLVDLLADTDCLFCGIVAGDLPGTIIDSDELTVSFMDIYHGVNLLNFCGRAAWQTVFHFHLHMIPRYDDDPLRLQWVPGPGDPDEIAAAADLLKGGP
jgi:histidine triad (HIT) family protein